MASLLNAIGSEAGTTFKLRIAKDTATCTVKRPALKASWRSSSITRGVVGDECTLSVKEHDEAQQFSGRRTTPKTSFVLMPTETENVLDLMPLKTEYDFHDSTPSAQVNGHTELYSQSDDEPDSDNPYDYRHYLQSNDHLSPYPSTTGTPLLALTPRASSPMMLYSDTESLLSLPTGQKRHKTASGASYRPTQSQIHKRPVQRRSPTAIKTSSPAPGNSHYNNGDGGLIIEDYSQPPPKRQRTVTKNTGPISLARASSTPRELSREATPRLNTASGGDDEDEENDDDHDIEDFRLPDPAARLSEPADRKDSIFDPVAVSNLLAAFGEDDEDATMNQAEAHKAESSESESEEE